MSFILDALRKSENERQRNQPLGVAASAGTTGRSGSGIWIPLVALLIGVNLSLLLVMWIMSDNSSEPQPAAVPPQQPAAVSPAPAAMPAPAPAQPRQPAAAPAQALTTSPPSSAAVPAEAVEEDSNLPTMEELVLQNLITIQPLRLDIHVYSDDPGERFVFINMARYNEGQSLKEGPTLLTINPGGVVLRHQGYDFLVTRE